MRIYNINFLSIKLFNSNQQIINMEYSQIVSPVSGFKFAADSSFFIHFDNTKLYVKECSVQMKNITIINAPVMITQVEISSNSKYVAVFMNKKCLINIYRIEDGALAAKIQDSQGGIVSMFWVMNSLQLMVFSQYMYKVSIYNLANQAMYYIKAPKISTQKGFSFSSDGKFLALLEKHECKDYVSVYYTNDWKIVNTFPLDLFDAVQVKWSPNNAYLAVWDNCINYRLIVLSHMLGQVLRYEPYNFALGIKTAKFANNSLFLAVGSFDQKIRLLNAMTWQQIGELDCSNPVINCDKIPVHKQQETSKNTNRMKIVQQKYFKIPTAKISTSAEKGVPNQGVGMLQFSEDDRFLACRNDNMPYTVWIWDVSTLQPASIISCTNHIKGIKWTDKQNFLCITTGTDRILFWRTNGTIAQCIFNFQHKKMNILKVKWSNDGNKALISDKNEIAYAELIPGALQKTSHL